MCTRVMFEPQKGQPRAGQWCWVAASSKQLRGSGLGSLLPMERFPAQ